ncbi:hypothetical protein [Granulicella sp. S156]|uniref:hypothetical protein n=1 Tax=Granulicella sp. S156 TaxID=1747224 RepID=UPI00131A9905|nr:hypothetical protein [Granulicella sp. S156]
MRTRTFTLVGAYVFLFCCLPAFGQAVYNDTSIHSSETAKDTDDPIAILEVGAATNWNLTGGTATFAPNLAAECTPIEHWLELEAGVSPFYTRNSTEWDTDLLFKKPWTISRQAEFMLGVGPQWTHLKQNGRTTNSVSGELAGDFMFWPSGRHRFGWFLEPAYNYSFAGVHQQSIGMSAGLLIGIR